VVVDFNGPGTLTVSTPGSTEDTTTAVSGAVLAWTDACGFIQLNYRQSGIAYEQTEPSTCFSQPTDETASDKCTRVSDAGSVEDPFSGESDPLIRYFYGYR
jgi:phage-related protein